MSDTLLDYSLSDGVATLHLNDGKANALSYEMIAALSKAIRRAEEEAQAAVILGMPGKFCAGFDLKIMQRSLSDAADLLREGGALYVQMLRSSIPLLSACTGHALAGGALLLLASDYSVGVEGAFKLGLNEVHIGLPLPLLALELTRYKLDARRLNEATLFGTLYEPIDAQRIGYLNETCTPDQFEKRVFERAAGMAQINRVAFKETKQRLWGGLATQIEATLQADLDAIRTLG